MNSISKRLLTLGLSFCFVLTGCGTSSSDDSTQSSTSVNSGVNNNYYSPDNIITPQEEVTSSSLVTYPGPSMLKTSSKIGLTVDDQDVFVYETRVNHKRSFTYDYSTDTAPVAIFDFSGKVHVKIKVNDAEVTSATVSPLAYGISPNISDNYIEFDLTNPADYTVEYNSDYKTAIHLFTSLPEENPITEEEAKKDSSIIYFGPGVYKVDSIPVKSNSTIYLAGGSYVYGQILTADLENVTIRGRGIIDGEIYDRKIASQKEIPIEFTRTNGITISGITILDPAGWASAFINCSNVNIDELRIVSARANGDGISLQSCSNVTVKNGFVRSWDDSLVVKNVDRGSTSNIEFNGVTVWTDLAQSMEVGYETNGPSMKDIYFKNITVVHNFHKACMSIHNCDDASISNIHFENITLEDGQMLGDVRNDGDNDFLIDMTIAYNAEWTKSGGKRGKIKDVYFKNIRIYNLVDSIVSRMQGEDSTSSIDNVTMSNIVIQGKTIKDKADLKLTTNDYVTGLTFQSSEEVAGAKLTLKYKCSTDGSNPSITNNTGVKQDGILVPESFQNKDTVSYIGEKADIGEATISITHGTGSTTQADYDDGTGSYDTSSNPSKNLIDGDRTTITTTKEYTGAQDEFIAVTVTFEKLTTVGVIRLLGDYANSMYSRYSISVFGRKMKTDGTPNEKFVRILSSSDYEITPSLGNYSDISFTPTGYLALQLRFFRRDDLGYTNKLELADLSFYPPSLTYNKPIVDSTSHYDVYDVSKINDGQTSGTSYYESSSLPAYVVIDMQDIYTLKYIVMFLPGLMSWSARTENIQILYSNDNTSYSSSTVFNTLVDNKDYLFDPSSGNMNIVDVSSKNIKARYIKLVINSNSAEGNYGGQLSEVSVYGF